MTPIYLSHNNIWGNMMDIFPLQRGGPNIDIFPTLIAAIMSRCRCRNQGDYGS